MTLDAFSYLSASKLLNQNIRNRKCLKTHRKFNCRDHPIGSLCLNLQCRLLPGNTLLTHRAPSTFPWPWLFSWNGPEKWRQPILHSKDLLMNNCCWGLNELPYDLSGLNPTTTKRHRVRVAADIRCEARFYFGLGVPLPKQGPFPGPPFCPCSRFQSLICWKAPSFSWLALPTGTLGDPLPMFLKALRRTVHSLPCPPPKASSRACYKSSSGACEKNIGFRKPRSNIWI